jgi:thymidylate synthase ThyX
MLNFKAEILADSVNPDGTRLTTMCVTYPRCIHAEMMTHRLFSRNTASSRAIPTNKLIDQVATSPFIPIHWGKNQKGMQAYEELTHEETVRAKVHWLEARQAVLDRVAALLELGLHKQIANRLLEPWLWHTAIITATEWENFFHLRCAPDAEPHIHKIACLMRDAYDASTPRYANWGHWHLPLAQLDDLSAELCMEDMVKVCVARCARVSYLTHDGRRDIQADLDLYDRLVSGGHMSPLEHVAVAAPISMYPERMWGNFAPGWLQHRKTIPTECIRERKNATDGS